ncbi:MAG: class I SAM-dependent methyltransferase, partial [Planctomycetota bacterium]
AGWTVHIDPARRDGSGRLLRLGDLAPGAGVIARLASRSAGAAIKLMPGVDEADLAGVGIEGELEYISRGGRLSQAVVWTGSLRRHRRSATVIDGSGRAHTIAGEPHEPGDAHGLGPWLVQPDPVAERAGLLPELADRSGLDVLHPRLGLLTGEALEPSAWLAGFRVIERMPWRVERVRASLASLDAGIVEVKTRGGACDPDEVQRQLRGDGERMLTVFVLRFGEKIEAIVTERG